MGYALLTKAHVRVDVLLVRFPPAVQGYLNTFALMLLNFMMGFVVYFAWKTVFFSFQIGAQAPTIQRTPLAWPQSVWAVGLTFFWFVAFIMLVETLLDLARGKAKELAHKIGPLSVQAEIDEALEAAGLESAVAEEARK
jgi:TRAP-type C4-dicarboxylate transport system permease small subunit